MEKLVTSASLMGQRKGTIFILHFIYWLIAPSLFNFFNNLFAPCRKRKPRKNTTKYGPNAKVPKAKKSKKSENPTVQPENVIVQYENVIVQPENVIVQSKNAIVQPENAIVQSENAIAVTSTPKRTKETILQESPIRLTRR